MPETPPEMQIRADVLRCCVGLELFCLPTGWPGPMPLLCSPCSEIIAPKLKLLPLSNHLPACSANPPATEWEQGGQRWLLTWLIMALGESWLCTARGGGGGLATLGRGCGLQVLVPTGTVFSRAPKACEQRAEASAPAAWTCPPTAPCSPPTDLPAGAPSVWPPFCWRTAAARCAGQHPAPSPPPLLSFPCHRLS